MNFIENESAQKLRGGFYTAPDIVQFLARWVLEVQPKSVLEPSCGDGVFLDAVASGKPSSVTRIFACEINPEEAAKAVGRLSAWEDCEIQVHPGDFLKWFVFQAPASGSFDAVLGNPPFIRYQYLAQEQQFYAEKIFQRFGLPFTKHTNAWVPFVIGSLSLLAPGGRLAMVIPSEIFHIRHAQSLRTFLSAQCSRILIVDPEELWFNEALQGVVLLLAEKKERADQSAGRVAACPVMDRAILSEQASAWFETAAYVEAPGLGEKWMPLFLSKHERALLEAVRQNPAFSRFVDLADVDVGIVTGANEFFLVTEKVVEEFELQPWAHPMFGRSEHVAGLILHDSDLAANRDADLPTHFLWFDALPFSSYPEPVRRYLASGEQQGLPKRYKCSVREPWYRVPSVYAAPVAMLKRAHQFPRLVFNEANAFSTDTAYRIQPRKIDGRSLVYSFLNSLTCVCAELEGRHYGGGVLELVPSEIERLLIPYCDVSEQELRELDARYRACTDWEHLLGEQDDVLLKGGLTADDRATIQGAWDRLRTRRQRRSGKVSNSL